MARARDRMESVRASTMSTSAAAEECHTLEQTEAVCRKETATETRDAAEQEEAAAAAGRGLNAQAKAERCKEEEESGAECRTQNNCGTREGAGCGGVALDYQGATVCTRCALLPRSIFLLKF